LGEKEDFMRRIGYCTNVHAGPNLEQTRANLERYALAVKERFSPTAPMGVGLWLAAPAARSLLVDDPLAVETFRDWLEEKGLVPFTFNGFPHGDFHQAVVKHRVYEPTWSNLDRLDYTRDLIEIQHQLLPEGVGGSISTLPIAWGQPGPSEDDYEQAAWNLEQVAEHLSALEDETGRRITLALEPEPGCVLQRSEDVVRFFEDRLLKGRDEEPLRRYITVCHDVCHAAVMFEEQADVLARFRGAGISVGKIQVSSAVALPFDNLPAGERPKALAQLAGFNEPRYLHQTVVKKSPQSEPVFYEDLHLALAQAGSDTAQLAGEWRVHFHVPIYLERFGLLETAQREILACLAECDKHSTTEHFEVETYAWGVLPEELRQSDLAAGIAEEMRWFAGVCRG
jgi:sugar phosphate isomerase/epimerase